MQAVQTAPRTEYEYKGLTYKFVKPCIKQSQRSKMFLNKMSGFTRDFAKESRLNLLSAIKKFSDSLIDIESEIKTYDSKRLSTTLLKIKDLIDNNRQAEADKFYEHIKDDLAKVSDEHTKTVYEFIDAYSEYTDKLESGVEIFLSNQANVKELFELCLLEPERINYNIETDEDVILFDNFRDEVLQGFFFSVLRKTKRLN